MNYVTHHDRATAYRHSDRGGAGPPLCLVHGSGGESGVWRSQFRLSDRFPVVAPDLSGHGDSDDVRAAPGYETLAAYADDALATLTDADHGPGETVFVGSSMGGAVCLHLAVERALSPRALVLAGSGPRLPVLDDLRTWLAGRPGTVGGPSDRRPDGFERALAFLHAPGRLFADADDRLREQSREAMRAAGRAVVHRDFETCHSFDVRGDLPAVDTPALAAVGEHDRLTPRRFHEELVDELPDAELAVVEDAGHLAMIERPRAFNAALREFLERRLDATG